MILFPAPELKEKSVTVMSQVLSFLDVDPERFNLDSLVVFYNPFSKTSAVTQNSDIVYNSLDSNEISDTIIEESVHLLHHRNTPNLTDITSRKDRFYVDILAEAFAYFFVVHYGAEKVQKSYKLFHDFVDQKHITHSQLNLSAKRINILKQFLEAHGEIVDLSDLLSDKFRSSCQYWEAVSTAFSHADMLYHMMNATKGNFSRWVSQRMDESAVLITMNDSCAGIDGEIGPPSEWVNHAMGYDLGSYLASLYKSKRHAVKDALKAIFCMTADTAAQIFYVTYKLTQKHCAAKCSSI